jgi:hypothetical protein
MGKKSKRVQKESPAQVTGDSDADAAALAALDNAPGTHQPQT